MFEVVITRELVFSTSGHGEVVKITDKVKELLVQSALKRGMILLFVPGNTAIVTTLEFEPGLVADIKNAWERLVPSEGNYEHNLRWGDGNGYAHVRSSFSGPSLVVPFEDGKPILGTWQDIVLIDFDNRPRDRRLIVQMMGE
ncbi:MAG: secondary thiamine-phosphate synthase enzyme YjbQ [Atribacterota bacterium]|nr:secondary thiamine-phosphate synthase enzyme YjbQ [Atribacterota bacterium]